MKNKLYTDGMVELLTELATDITEAEFGEGTYRAMLDGSVIFWEDAQEFYDTKYEEIETLLNKVANIYRN